MAIVTILSCACVMSIVDINDTCGYITLKPYLEIEIVGKC